MYTIFSLVMATMRASQATMVMTRFLNTFPSRANVDSLVAARTLQLHNSLNFTLDTVFPHERHPQYLVETAPYCLPRHLMLNSIGPLWIVTTNL